MFAQAPFSHSFSGNWRSPKSPSARKTVVDGKGRPANGRQVQQLKDSVSLQIPRARSVVGAEAESGGG